MEQNTVDVTASDNKEKKKIFHAIEKCNCGRGLTSGVTVQMDNDMIRHYCNEDSFLIQINPVDEGTSYSITLIELDTGLTTSPSL
ncbi:hypothetical protein D918_02298 [Trichuris suis]|nr:hypothetical protein D918_02298 [Trichuris suis]